MKVSGLWEEFKAFAFKGNMIDLAVAVVIGGAFGKIITAIVNDIIMPLVGYTLKHLHIPPDYVNWHLGAFKIGDLLSEVVQFIITCHDLNSRLMNRLSSLGRYGKWLSDQELSRAHNCLGRTVSCLFGDGSGGCR